jgi:PAS domain S-box-containing protein
MLHGVGDISRELPQGDSVLNAAYLVAIVDSCDDAIIGKDLRGNIRSWNRGAQEIFGYTPDEVIGRSIQLLFPPDRLDEEDMIFQRIRDGEKVDHFETLRRRKDGSDFQASVTISPIRDADGVIVGASKVLRDISERHRAQMELAQAKADLEHLVAERTKALGERDLLLREVYHRVKNNLQVIDGLMLMKAMKMADPLAREALMEMRSRVFALSLVHQQLMGSSNLKTFKLGPFLTELSTNIIGGAADDRITLTVDARPLDVGLDFAAPLGLLVTEIVTNSLKHAFPDGSGDIKVSLRVDAGKWVVLTVADNGQGQVNGHLIAARAGSGLSIVRKLVAQLGGEMSVRQVAGTTTEIVVPLPEFS